MTNFQADTQVSALFYDLSDTLFETVSYHLISNIPYDYHSAYNHPQSFQRTHRGASLQINAILPYGHKKSPWTTIIQKMKVTPRGRTKE